MFTRIENQFLAVRIAEKGAELASVVNKTNQLGYLWDGNPQFWPRVSPVLFPVVGTLKEGRYYYRDRWYAMPRHGFARDQPFSLEESEKDEAVFKFSDTTETFKTFPFHFDLRLRYRLAGRFLHVTYEVTNTGDDDMYFSIGGHPAFRVPMTETSAYEDHYLEFNVPEHIDRWPLTEQGLIGRTSEPLLENSDRLDLTRGLFSSDALVLKHLKSSAVSLKSDVHDHRVDFYFDGFPYLGIWAAPGADFVCIEPWCGIADSVEHDQHLAAKEGVESLLPGRSWSRTWKAGFY